jgi:hypothetical protein
MRSLSLQRGESITRRFQDSTADTIWITTAVNVPARGFLTPPPFIGVGARWGSSEKAPVVDLSLSFDEGHLIADVTRDEAFVRRLFCNLNRDVLGPPDDGKIIIPSDSNEEEGVHKEKAVDAEPMSSSAIRSPASTASTDTDDAPTGVKNDNSDDCTPDQKPNDNSDSGDDTRLP